MQSRTTVISPQRSQIVKTPRYIQPEPISRYRRKPSIYIDKSTFNGKRKHSTSKSLYISAGYGERQTGPIKPFSNLIFTIELLSVEAGQGAPTPVQPAK